VTCIVKIRGVWFGWDIRGYRPKSSCSDGEFQSKVDLATSILASFRERIDAPFTVLMDSWYTCAPILNLISASGGTFVAAIKRNRIVENHGIKTVVSHLAKGPRDYKTVRASKKQRFRVAKQIVFLPKVGMVALFITKGAGAKARFLITNDLAMTEEKAVALYKQRFRIETFHKEIKQHLAFGQMFMRSWQGVQAHWTLVMIAYNLITLLSRKRFKGFRQKISHFRDSGLFTKMLRASTRNT
jgi:IS4 transposase